MASTARPYSDAVRSRTSVVASIFKRISEVPENSFGPVSADYTTAYKVCSFHYHRISIDLTLVLQKYNVLRKMPMLGRHERILAIDGVYVHVCIFLGALDNDYTLKLLVLSSCQRLTRLVQSLKTRAQCHTTFETSRVCSSPPNHRPLSSCSYSEARAALSDMNLRRRAPN
jgi:hypothetical protein